MNGTGWPPAAIDLAAAELQREVERLAAELAVMREQLDAVLAVVSLPPPATADDPYPAAPLPPLQPRQTRGLGRLISRDA